MYTYNTHTYFEKNLFIHTFPTYTLWLSNMVAHFPFFSIHLTAQRLRENYQMTNMATHITQVPGRRRRETNLPNVEDLYECVFTEIGNLIRWNLVWESGTKYNAIFKNTKPLYSFHQRRVKALRTPKDFTSDSKGDSYRVAVARIGGCLIRTQWWRDKTWTTLMAKADDRTKERWSKRLSLLTGVGSVLACLQSFKENQYRLLLGKGIYGNNGRPKRSSPKKEQIMIKANTWQETFSKIRHWRSKMDH